MGTEEDSGEGRVEGKTERHGERKAKKQDTRPPRATANEQKRCAERKSQGDNEERGKGKVDLYE
jgi:hypothetical protein